MKPILFNTPMVQAILAGNKTQTRRVVTPQPQGDTAEIVKDDGCFFAIISGNGHFDPFFPRYKPGDVLYVRETWLKVPGLPPFLYKASCHDGSTRKWRPSIHMPKEAARLFLRVTDVRVERLQDIDENGAIAEGFYKGWRLDCLPRNFIDGPSALSARQAFMWFWERMTRNAPATESWACNPFVWVYSFERISRERAEAAFIGTMDSQRGTGKAIFGGGLLLSERAAAERAAATRWALSDREKEIQKHLGGKP